MSIRYLDPDPEFAPNGKPFPVWGGPRTTMRQDFYDMYQTHTMAGQMLNRLRARGFASIPTEDKYKNQSGGFNHDRWWQDHPHAQQLLPFANEFRYVKDQGEAEALADVILTNLEARARMDSAQFSMLAGLAAGFADPTNLVALPFSVGAGFVRGAAHAMKSALPLIGTAEAVRHSLDPTSNYMETFLTTAFGTGFVGVMGGMHGAWTKALGMDLVKPRTIPETIIAATTGQIKPKDVVDGWKMEYKATVESLRKSYHWIRNTPEDMLAVRTPDGHVRPAGDQNPPRRVDPASSPSLMDPDKPGWQRGLRGNEAGTEARAYIDRNMNQSDPSFSTWKQNDSVDKALRPLEEDVVGFAVHIETADNSAYTHWFAKLSDAVEHMRQLYKQGRKERIDGDPKILASYIPKGTMYTRSSKGIVTQAAMLRNGDFELQHSAKMLLTATKREHSPGVFELEFPKGTKTHMKLKLVGKQTKLEVHAFLAGNFDPVHPIYRQHLNTAKQDLISAQAKHAELRSNYLKQKAKIKTGKSQAAKTRHRNAAEKIRAMMETARTSVKVMEERYQMAERIYESAASDLDPRYHRGISRGISSTYGSTTENPHWYALEAKQFIANGHDDLARPLQLFVLQMSNASGLKSPMNEAGRTMGPSVQASVGKYRGWLATTIQSHWKHYAKLNGLGDDPNAFNIAMMGVRSYFGQRKLAKAGDTSGKMPDGTMTMEAFNREVFRATATGKHSNENILAAAKEWNEYFKRMEVEARKVGMFRDDADLHQQAFDLGLQKEQAWEEFQQATAKRHEFYKRSREQQAPHDWREIRWARLGNEWGDEEEVTRFAQEVLDKLDINTKIIFANPEAGTRGDVIAKELQDIGVAEEDAIRFAGHIVDFHLTHPSGGTHTSINTPNGPAVFIWLANHVSGKLHGQQSLLEGMYRPATIGLLEPLQEGKTPDLISNLWWGQADRTVTVAHELGHMVDTHLRWDLMYHDKELYESFVNAMRKNRDTRPDNVGQKHYYQNEEEYFAQNFAQYAWDAPDFRSFVKKLNRDPMIRTIMAGKSLFPKMKGVNYWKKYYDSQRSISRHMDRQWHNMDDEGKQIMRQMYLNARRRAKTHDRYYGLSYKVPDGTEQREFIDIGDAEAAAKARYDDAVYQLREVEDRIRLIAEGKIEPRTLAGGDNYVPHVWKPEELKARKEEAIAMLERKIMEDRGNKATPEGVRAAAEEAYASLLHQAHLGVDDAVEAGLGAEKLDWLYARRDSVKDRIETTRRSSSPEDQKEFAWRSEQLEIIQRKIEYLERARQLPELGEHPQTIYGRGSPFQKRPLTFTTEELMGTGFIETDMALVGMHYNSRTGSRIEIKRRFGDSNARGFLMEWYSRTARELDKRGDTKTLAALKDYYQAARDVTDRALGLYGLPEDPEAFTHQAASMLMALNVVTAMGGSTLMAFADMGSVIIANGVRRTIGGLLQRWTHDWRTSGIQIANEEALKIGSAVEITLGHRFYAMTELGNRFHGLAKAERFAHSQVGNFFLVNLMGPWTDMLKRTSSFLSADNILTWVSKPYAQLTEYQRAQLASMGIDRIMAGRIRDQWKLRGSPQTKKGLKLSDSDQWVDGAARDAFRAALHQWVEIQVPTPDKVLDKPNFLVREDWAKVMLQYKTFPLMATWKVMGNAFSYADGDKMAGLLSMVAIAYMTDLLVRRPDYIDMDFKDSLLRAVELSGVTGIMLDANDTIERATAGAVGLRPLLGMDIRERHPNWATQIGAVGGAVPNQWGALAYALLDPDAQFKDTARAIRYLIPGNNLIWTKGLFNRMQRHVVEMAEGEDEP